MDYSLGINFQHSYKLTLGKTVSIDGHLSFLHLLPFLQPVFFAKYLFEEYLSMIIVILARLGNAPGYDFSISFNIKFLKLGGFSVG